MYFYWDFFQIAVKDSINEYIYLILLDISDLFVYASKLTDKFRFNYKNDRLFIKLLLSGLDKHFIYYFTDLLDFIKKEIV